MEFNKKIEDSKEVKETTESRSEMKPRTVGSLKTKTKDPVELDVRKNVINTTVNYKVRQVIPKKARITKKAVVVYGEDRGVKKLITMSDRTNGQFSIDNKYVNPTLDIDIEYEYEDKYYSLKEKVKLDQTKRIQINKEIQGKEIRTTEEYLDYLETKIDSLETRLYNLENKG